MLTADGRTWTPALGARLFLGLWAIGCVVGSALPWDDGTYYARDVWVRLGLVALGGWLALLAQRPRLTLTRDAVEMRYLFSMRVIALAEVVEATPTQQGLLIQTADGDSVLTPPFIGEKAPLSDWLRRRTASDRLAETILAARPTA